MEDMLAVLKERKIGVLAGGVSSERDVSLKSGHAVFDALVRKGLRTVFLDVRPDNFEGMLKGAGIDVAFLALHGKFGEDGTVQKILSDKKVRYTGSGPSASSAAMDKVSSKIKFAAAGLNVPDQVVLDKAARIDAGRIRFPCVVKPATEGSSIGLSVVHEAADFKGAVEKALGYCEKAIVEKYISGREMTVGILEERALPVVEVFPVEGVYDFRAKYSSPETEYVVPARLDADVYRFVQEYGVRAHKALGCRGISRVDMRLSDEGEIYVLEVNTIPGFTERSLLPMAAKADGIGFSELCIRMLASAFDLPEG